MNIVINQDNKSYRVPVHRDMSYLLNEEVLSAFSWREDDEDRSDYFRGFNGELDEC